MGLISFLVTSLSAATQLPLLSGEPSGLTQSSFSSKSVVSHSQKIYILTQKKQTNVSFTPPHNTASACSLCVVVCCTFRAPRAAQSVQEVMVHETLHIPLQNCGDTFWTPQPTKTDILHFREITRGWKTNGQLFHSKKKKREKEHSVTIKQHFDSDKTKMSVLLNLCTSPKITITLQNI